MAKKNVLPGMPKSPAPWKMPEIPGAPVPKPEPAPKPKTKTKKETKKKKAY